MNGYGVTESAVRIKNEQDRVCGTGVAVSPRHVATCAHVVLDALGLKPDGVPPLGAKVGATGWRSQQPEPLRLKVLIEAWRPVAEGDLAVLELFPEDADLLPACMRISRGDEWQGYKVDAYGFPEGFDKGQAATLSCQLAIADSRIQCAPDREGIDHGYSGGPVFVAGDLVGLAQALRRSKDPALKYDYIIPIARLHELMPRLAGVVRQPYFALAEALINGSSEAAPDLLASVRNSSPHTLDEYRLQRHVRDWETRDVRLDFTPLWMLLEDRRRDSIFGEGPQPERLDDLGAALEHEHRAYILKGAPGGGKTTLLKRLAFDLTSASGDSEWVPVLVELASHRGGANPGDWLERRWRRKFDDMPELPEVSRDAHILWLLDGLNELPDEAAAPRSSKIAAWRDWLGTQVNRHRVIISCRSADYLEELDEIGDQPVPHLELQPLDLMKIAEFLRHRSALDKPQAEAAIRRIEARDLVGLYNTPLMLTLLEVVLTPQGDFPDGRADLFSTYLLKLVLREGKKHHTLIDALLSTSELKAFQDAVRPSDTKHDRRASRKRLLRHDNRLFDALSEQSYGRQRAEYRGERQEVSFDRLDLEASLRYTYGEERGEQIFKAAQALNLLIEGESSDSLRFRHQQFQEFFAARKLVQTRELALAAAPHRLEDFKQSLEAVRRAMKPWQELPGVDRSGWEETVLMAAELIEDGDAWVRDLAEVNLPLAGQCAALKTVAVHTHAPLAERLLARMRDSRADLRARIAAGHALGEMEALEVLGYRMLTDGDGKRLAWLPPMEAIPAGDYTFGSEGDPEAYEWEHRFSRHLPGFRLGLYPLSNAEWRCFIEAGGYSESRWWRGEASNAFFEGHGTNEGQAQSWLYWRGERDAGRLEERLEGARLRA